MTVMAIARRLRQLHEAMGWTQTVMARQVGVGLTTWNNYETGVSPIPWRTALILCTVTGASMDWIYRNQRGLMPIHIMEKIDESGQSTA